MFLFCCLLSTEAIAMTTSISMFVHDQPVDTHHHYYVTFFEDEISTLVTDTPTYVDKWISQIKRAHSRHLYSLVVGLDVEWCPNQSKNSNNPVATLQLCVGHDCLIFQILHSQTVPYSLKNFLGNASYTFTGVGIENDVKKLKEDYNLVVARTVDLRALAVEAYNAKEFHNAGLKGLARKVLGKEIKKPKGITMSQWDTQVLTPKQVQYACIDVFLSFEIGKILILQNQN